jgi:3-oxoacyl-ACP reductase-like protein
MSSAAETYLDVEPEAEDGGAMQGTQEAPSSVQQQLDKFAPSESQAVQGESGSAEKQPGGAAATGTAGAAAPSEADLKAAYVRGQEQKAANHSRKALPGELRGNEALSIAWYAGFDGRPFE